MKFNSRRKKIKYIQNKQIENEARIIEQNTKNELIDNDFNKKNKQLNSLNIVREIETDWKEMKYREDVGEVPDYLVDQSYGWKIELGEMPEIYIPFIKVNILYRNVVNTDDKTLHTYLYKDSYKLIEDLPNGNKKVTLYASFRCFSGTFDIPVNNRFEGKIRIQILNPLSV